MEKILQTKGPFKYRYCFSDDDLRTIKFLYNRGKSIREIASYYKIHPSTLFYYMKRNNIRTGMNEEKRQRQRDSQIYGIMIGKNGTLQPIINKTTGAVYSSIKEAARCLFIWNVTAFVNLRRKALKKGIILERGEKYIRNH